jgi:curli biogenesis system outer membrane secretion channel CsgG
MGRPRIAGGKLYAARSIFFVLICVALAGLTTTQLRAASPAQAGRSSPPQQTPPATQKRIAILAFEDTAVKNSAMQVFGYDVNVGKGVADLLVRELMKSDSYSVMDPKTVDKLLAGHVLPTTNLADRETAVKLGKILGVDGMVIGDVTRFGDVGQRTGFDETPRRRAAVEAMARVVDVASGMIVAVAGGQAESQRTGASLLAGWHRVGDGPIDFGSSDFQRTLLGEAVNAAVTQMAAELAADSSRLPSASSRQGVPETDPEVWEDIGGPGGIRTPNQGIMSPLL